MPEDNETSDPTHELLITDLENLLMEARDYQFHDFKNDKYPSPKIELVKRFQELAQNAKNGDYDN